MKKQVDKDLLKYNTVVYYEKDSNRRTRKFFLYNFWLFFWFRSFLIPSFVLLFPNSLVFIR